MLYVQIKNINSKNNIIELPVREADPEPINLEKIRKEIRNEFQKTGLFNTFSYVFFNEKSDFHFHFDFHFGFQFQNQIQQMIYVKYY